MLFLVSAMVVGPGLAVGDSSKRVYGIEDLRRFLAAGLSSGEQRIVMPPGIYRGSVDGNVFATIRGAKDLVIDATGVELRCGKLTRALELHDCRNVELVGLTVDYDPPPFTQGDIVAVDPQGKWVDVRIHEGYPIKPYDRIDIVDRATRHRKHGMPFLWGTKARMIGERTVRVQLDNGFEGSAAVGDLASLSTGPQDGGIAHGIEIRNSEGVVLRDVTVHSAPGFGIINGGGEGAHRYERVKVVPGPRPAGATEDRLLSSSWDAIQFNNLRQGPVVEGCVVGAAGDDSLSLSSRDYLVLASAGKTVWLVSRVPHEDALAVGDRLALSLDGVKPRIVELEREPVPLERCPISPELLDRIRGAERWSYFEFELHRIRRAVLDVDYPWEAGVSVYSPDRNCSGFVFRNNTFHSAGRAGLINGASDGLIEGNTYIDCDAVLSVYPNLPAGAATGSSNITFRNNVVRGGNNFCPAPWSLCGGVVTIYHTAGAKQPADAGVFRNIRIENNVFESVRGPVFVITSTRGLRIADNRIVDCQHQPHLGSGRDWGVDGTTLGWLKRNEEVELVNNAIVNRGPQGTNEAFVQLP